MLNLNACVILCLLLVFHSYRGADGAVDFVSKTRS